MNKAMSLRVEGVTKHYRAGGSTVRAVDGIDLVIEAGTSVAIVGPSGWGKSTLLRLLGGLVGQGGWGSAPLPAFAGAGKSPATGRIWLNEVEISSLPESARARVRRE